MKVKGLLLAAVMGALFALPAAATMINCSANTNLNHMKMDDSQAAACLLSGAGNLTGNADNDLFLNSAMGAGYSLASKSDEANPFNVGYDSDGSYFGNWWFDASFWDSYDAGALAFKFGTGQTIDQWFVFSLQDLISAGDWSFFFGSDYERWTGGGLSHVNLYGTPKREVPEPHALALFLVGLLGLVVARRRV